MPDKTAAQKLLIKEGYNEDCVMPQNKMLLYGNVASNKNVTERFSII